MRVRALVFAGTMAGLAALLQTAPTWFGEPAGYALAILASLPAAVAATAYPREAPYAVLSTCLVCLFINPQEAWVFALTNGAFGIVLGRNAHSRVPWVKSILSAAGTLWAGIVLLTWGVGVAALGSDLLKYGIPFTFAAYGAFALVWAAAFTGLFRLIHQRIAPVLAKQNLPQ